MVLVNLNDRTLPKGGKSLRLKSDDRVEDFWADLQTADSVLIEFAQFSDGRGFTQARRLRGQFGFAGEIRAVGHVLPDQAGFLLRCGFDNAEYENEARANAARKALAHFTVRYQPAEDTDETAALERIAGRQFRRAS